MIACSSVERDPDGADSLARLERGVGPEIRFGVLVAVQMEDRPEPAERPRGMRVSVSGVR